MYQINVKKPYTNSSILTDEHGKYKKKFTELKHNQFKAQRCEVLSGKVRNDTTNINYICDYR